MSSPTGLSQVLLEGQRIAASLESQNAELATRVAQLEQELAKAVAQSKDPLFAPPDAATQGADQIRLLQQALRQKEAECDEVNEEINRLSQQNTNYLSLYVASSQLHSTTDFANVIRSIQEIIINLIGADQFAFYLFDAERREFKRVASEGERDPADEVIPFGDNLLSRVARSETLCLDVKESDLPSGAVPIAVLPLSIGHEPIGVIVLFQLLVQKGEFDEFDLELFNLLAAHAASALASSLSFRRLERQNKTLKGLLDLFKTGGGSLLAAEGP
ncbi:MAG: GAF domain-containing protein [Polyangiaceae bacterium]|nr:GAF domain-containing protein [Polyangiaceae bacterium]